MAMEVAAAATGRTGMICSREVVLCLSFRRLLLSSKISAPNLSIRPFFKQLRQSKSFVEIPMPCLDSAPRAILILLFFLHAFLWSSQRLGTNVSIRIEGAVEGREIDTIGLLWHWSSSTTTAIVPSWPAVTRHHGSGYLVAG